VTGLSHGRRDGHFPASSIRFPALAALSPRPFGAGPVMDDVVLMVSELCANALLHTISGDNGMFEVAVVRNPLSVRVEVRDGGSQQALVLGSPDSLAENGRGLGLVELIADNWGHNEDQQGRLVFFEARWDAAGLT
jgi:anti-sigma regulatory factor (Ser/Thr protein kinase)